VTTPCFENKPLQAQKTLRIEEERIEQEKIKDKRGYSSGFGMI
jgi:hypothetical protein